MSWIKRLWRRVADQPNTNKYWRTGKLIRITDLGNDYLRRTLNKRTKP